MVRRRALGLLAVACAVADRAEEDAWVARWRDGFDEGWRHEVGPIDVGCTFRVRLGLVGGGGVAAGGPALEVRYGAGETLVDVRQLGDRGFRWHSVREGELVNVVRDCCEGGGTT